MSYSTRSGLQVSDIVVDFIENKAVSDSGITAQGFWDAFANLVEWAMPRNKELLAIRKEMKEKIDA